MLSWYLEKVAATQELTPNLHSSPAPSPTTFTLHPPPSTLILTLPHPHPHLHPRQVAATQEREAWSNTGGGLVGLILHDLGLSAGDTISFSQFVLWLSTKEPGSGDNIHIMPWSVRCGAVGPSSYSMVGQTETLEADLQSLLGALHWDQARILT